MGDDRAEAFNQGDAASDARLSGLPQPAFVRRSFEDAAMA